MINGRLIVELLIFPFKYHVFDSKCHKKTKRRTKKKVSRVTGNIQFFLSSHDLAQICQKV